VKDADENDSFLPQKTLEFLQRLMDIIELRGAQVCAELLLVSSA